MTEEQADARASVFNHELRRGKPTNKFYVPVEVAPGEWTVELRTEQKRPWWKRVIAFLLDILASP